MKNIVIVGGGAAGIFCAANLNEEKYKVTILEQGADVLQKVKISGGRRCNVTHACFEPAELAKFYPRGHRELRSVFSRYQPADTISWFEQRGVELKTEADGRMFPVSNLSQSIINAMLKSIEEKNFTIKTRCGVRNIIKNDDHYVIETSAGNFVADIVIYTTGSTPKSLKILQKLGHTIVDAVPSLFTFNVEDEWIKKLPGTAVAEVEISIPELKTQEYGALLITHWGISGPAVLKISAWKARELAALNYLFSVRLNFLNDSFENTVAFFSDLKNKTPKKSIFSLKPAVLTNRLWQAVLDLSKLDGEKAISNLSKKELNHLAENLTRCTLQVVGKSTNKDEFVTAGGVELKEIDFKNMSSRKLEHFFIAGEVLNIDAVTGGFNFQACWSEAFVIAEFLNAQ